MIKMWSLTLTIRFRQMFAQVTTKRTFPENKQAHKQIIVTHLYSLIRKFTWAVQLNCPIGQFKVPLWQKINYDFSLDIKTMLTKH